MEPVEMDAAIGFDLVEQRAGDSVEASAGVIDLECRSFFSKSGIGVGLLVVALATLGVCMNPMGVQGVSVEDVGLCLRLGVVFSQPLLFAFWAALSSQRLYRRFLWSFLLCAVVSFAVDLGSVLHGNVEFGNVMLFLVAGFIATTVALLAFRRFFRWRIAGRNAEDIPADYQAHQCGIKHLFLLVTIAALVCGLIRTLALINPGADSSTAHSETGWAGILSYIIFVVAYVAFFSPVLAIPWFTMGWQGRAVRIVLITIAMLAVIDLSVGCLIGVIAVHTMTPSNVLTTVSDMLQFCGAIARGMLVIQAGAGLSVLASSLIARWCGFRMVRDAKIRRGRDCGGAERQTEGCVVA